MSEGPYAANITTSMAFSKCGDDSLLIAVFLQLKRANTETELFMTDREALS